MPIGYEHLRHPRDIGPGLVTPEVRHETPLEATRCAFYAPIICRVMDNVDPALGHSSPGAWMSHATTAARHYSRGAASRRGPV